MKAMHSSEIGIKHRELLSRHATLVPNVYSRISRRSQALQDSLRTCARLLRAFLRVHWHLRNNCRQSARPLHPLHPEPSRLLQITTNSRISRITASFSASHGRRGQPISGVPRRAHVYPWAPLCAPPFTPAGSLSLRTASVLGGLCRIAQLTRPRNGRMGRFYRARFPVPRKGI